jgi:glucose-1-phosphate adenylyltransferase
MKKEIIAMLLAGGKGTRLLSLTRKTAKPAVYFGGKYRIIDFPLSNCTNSNIDIVGVLTQYESVQLNDYIGSGNKWGFEGNHSKVVLLPPREKEEGSSWYRGTADAITQNLDFIEEYEPEYVLILSGDHIYKMDYEKMLDYHKQTNADVTIAVLNVDLKEASRFGIMTCDENFRITQFDEKPKNPKSTLASMGIYIFTYKRLKKFLLEEDKQERNEHDFGKHIIPAMLAAQEVMMAYEFKGYWKDVGTVNSLWEANMDLLTETKLDLFDREQNWKIYSEDTFSLPQYLGEKAKVINSIVNQGCRVNGSVKDSVLFSKVKVRDGAIIEKAVILPDCVIEAGARLKYCIVEAGRTVREDEIFEGSPDEIILVK